MHRRKRDVLTQAKVKNAPAGRHGDGGGLYLNVTGTGSRSWVFRWVKHGRAREMGLGPWPEISLAMARDLAFENRRAVVLGDDPLEARRAQRQQKTTFGDVADEFLKVHERRWTNPKTSWQWSYTLNDVAADLRKVPVADLTTDDVVKLLKPMWTATPEKARKTRMRLEKVLDFATSKKLRHGDNPARLKGNLEHQLPQSKKLSRGHHKALPYDEVPALMRKLRTVDTMSSRSLRFLILTAARTGEVLKATWNEVDWDNKLWVIPASRMKMKRDHRVPLTAEAMAILQELYETRTGDLIFEGAKRGKPQSNMAMATLLRRLNIDVTVHGFRSSFRDWAGDKTNVAREIVETALAHKVGNDVELAYRRSDALEKRRDLMTLWAEFID